jgi:hypothetical protein
MDVIYESAIATIIAVTDKNSKNILPGVGGTPRKPQPQAVVGDKLFVSSMPHLSRFLEQSSWNTRGWTYQEAVLSRRCLFFTSHQVYFVCRAMTCCESMNSNPPDLALRKAAGPGPMLRARLFGGAESRSVQEQFFNHVEQYTARKLSNHRDSLDAFRGLLARALLSGPSGAFPCLVFKVCLQLSSKELTVALRSGYYGKVLLLNRRGLAR